MDNKITVATEEDLKYFKNKIYKVLQSDELKGAIAVDNLEKVLGLINKPIVQYKVLDESLAVYRIMREKINDEVEAIKIPFYDKHGVGDISTSEFEKRMSDSDIKCKVSNTLMVIDNLGDAIFYECSEIELECLKYMGKQNLYDKGERN
jgi:hypothetical protein